MSRSVSHNAAWNVAGMVIPSIAGVAAVPFLLEGLGAARLGVFTLAIGLIGFAGLFDLGLGRALTHAVASERGRGSDPSSLAALIRTAVAILFALGVFWACALWIAIPALVERVFGLEGSLQREGAAGLRWVAVSLPAALVSTGLVGCLEGFQRFAAVNVVRLFLGSASFVVPAATAMLSGRLDLALASLALVRVIALLPWLFLARTHVSSAARGKSPEGALARLTRFGAWLTVSSVVGPLMVFADRFYLASVFPPATVALYTVPLDAVSRLASLPMSAVNAAFPELSKRSATGAGSAELVKHAISAMTFAWFPLVAVLMLLAEELLGLWLNAAIAFEAKEIARWLLLGVFLNGFAHVPYALLQAKGRSDVTAKLHLAELPLYGLLLVLAVAQMGISGAAVAWCLRTGFDAVLLFVAAARGEPPCTGVLKQAGLRLAMCTVALVGCMLEASTGLRWGLVLVMLLMLAESLRRFVKRRVHVR